MAAKRIIKTDDSRILESYSVCVVAKDLDSGRLTFSQGWDASIATEQHIYGWTGLRRAEIQQAIASKRADLVDSIDPLMW
jgi:hypothetical protein